MEQIKNLPNTEAPSVDYPNGSIKDDTGLLDGTPVNRLVFSDMFQFFGKMFDESFLIPNDLPDNETNGYQLYQAFFAPFLKLNGWFNERVSAEDITVATITDIATVELSNTFAFGIALVASPATPSVKNLKLSDGSLVGSYTDQLVTPTKVIYNNDETFYVLDTGNLSNRVLLFSLDEDAVVDAFGLPADITGATDFFIKGNKCYILTQTNGVKVYNKTTGAHLSGEDFGSGGGNFTDGSAIFIAHEKAYISDRNTSTIFVYDLATGTHLSDEDFGAGVLSDPRSIHIVGNKLYAADNSGVVFVFDISSGTQLKSDFIATNLTTPTVLFISKVSCKGYVYDTTSGEITVFKQNFVVDHI